MVMKPGTFSLLYVFVTVFCVDLAQAIIGLENVGATDQ